MVSKHLWATFVLSFVMLCFLFYYQWIIGVTLAIILITTFYYVKREETNIKQKQRAYISNLAYQVEQAGKHIFLDLPMGIIIYNDDFTIEWANPYMTKLFDDKNLIKQSLQMFDEQLIAEIKADKEEVWIEINHFQFKTKIVHENRTILFFNRTEEAHLEKLFYE